MESDPQPVTTAAWWTGTITSLILGTVAILTAFDVWHPTQDQITAMTAGAAVIVATVFPLIAYFVRKRVTPNENVALTKSEVKILDAWATPAPYTAPLGVQNLGPDPDRAV